MESLFFSTKNFELLHKYQFLAPMCAELVDKLPLFTLLNSSLILTDKDAPAEEFIPRAHHIMSQYRDLLERGEFAGKQIADMSIYEMWKAETLKHAHCFRLSEEWTETVQGLKDGTKVGGFESYEEMKFRSETLQLQPVY
jgi:hypothetical protein